MAIKRYAGDKFYGESTDPKPSDVPDGAHFLESNTLKQFIRVGGTWVELTGSSGYSGFSGYSGAGGGGSNGLPIILGFLTDDTELPPVYLGDKYIIGAGISGFSGYDGYIAEVTNETGPVWSFTAPASGMMASVKDGNGFFHLYTAIPGIGWNEVETSNAIQGIISNPDDFNPSYGIKRVVCAGGTMEGAFIGHTNHIATMENDGVTWTFRSPFMGEIVYNLGVVGTAENDYWVWNFQGSGLWTLLSEVYIGISGYSGYSGAGGGGAGITDILYADLVDAIEGSTLTPGAYYRITDFATVHYIVDANNTRYEDIHTGDTEPLIVKAVADNKLDKQAYSEQYPQDIIYYDWSPYTRSLDPSFDDLTSNVAQGDLISLSGTSGTAEITCNGVTKVITFNTSLAQTVTDFCTENSGGDFRLAQVNAGPGNYYGYANTAIYFFSQIPGLPFVAPTITNLTGDLAGTVENKFANVTATVAGFKGVIYHRHDTKFNNSLGYDFRNVVIRRWETEIAEWDSEGSYTYGNYVSWDRPENQGGGTFISMCVIDSPTDSPANYYTNQWIIVLDISLFRFWLNTPTDLDGNPLTNYYDFHTFAGWDNNGNIGFVLNTYNEGCRNNTIGNRNDGNGILPNNVFFLGGQTYGNKIGVNFIGNTIGQEFALNTFGGDCYNNKIGGSFLKNKVGNYCGGNFIGYDASYNSFSDYTSSNYIGQSFQENSLASQFQSNIIHLGFSLNRVGGGFTYNFIGRNSTQNDFGESCSGNYIFGGAENNIIGPYCQNNYFNYLYDNHIEAECTDNTDNTTGLVGVDMSNCDIGPGFTYNAIDSMNYSRVGTSFSGNYIGVNFDYNEVDANFGNNTIDDAFAQNIVQYNFQSKTIGLGCQRNIFCINYPISTIGDYFTDNDTTNIIDITYAELINILTPNSGFVLIKGKKYRITDFATTHFIVDSDNLRYTDIITGATEPLIVCAVGAKELDSIAYSELYPQDIIHYDWNQDNWINDLSFSDVTANVAQVSTFTLYGTSGGFDIIYAGGLTRPVSFDTDLTTTAANFVTAYAADYLAQGIVVTSSGADIIFTAKVPGVSFVNPQYSNNTGDLYGSNNETQVNVSGIVTGFKGVITFRHDTLLDNYTGYDFRACKFRRWKTDVAAYASGTTYGKGGLCSYDGFIYKSSRAGNVGNTPALGSIYWVQILDITVNEYWLSTPNDPNIPADTLYDDFLTFTPDGTEFGTYEYCCRSNHFDSVKGDNTYSGSGVCNLEVFTLLSNNVVFLQGVSTEATFNSNTFAPGCSNNTIAALGFINNQTRSTFSSNMIWGYFLRNSFAGECYLNIFAFDFESNHIGSMDNSYVCSVVTNTLGQNFSSNLIGPAGDPEVGYNFYGNGIGGNFTGNVVIGNFYFNTIGQECQDNNFLGTDAGATNYNIIGDAFKTNTIGDNFAQNNISSNFAGNTIGDDSSRNTIGPGAVSNTIDARFEYNNIGADFASNDIGTDFAQNCILYGFASNIVGNNFASNLVGAGYSSVTIPADVSYKVLNLIIVGGFTTSFVDGDLSSGILTVTHSLGQKYVSVQVYDDSDMLIIPDGVTLTDVDTLSVDLSSYGTITGTWNVVVK